MVLNWNELGWIDSDSIESRFPNNSSSTGPLLKSAVVEENIWQGEPEQPRSRRIEPRLDETLNQLIIDRVKRVVLNTVFIPHKLIDTLILWNWFDETTNMCTFQNNQPTNISMKFCLNETPYVLIHYSHETLIQWNCILFRITLSWWNTPREYTKLKTINVSYILYRLSPLEACCLWSCGCTAAVSSLAPVTTALVGLTGFWPRVS